MQLYLHDLSHDTGDCVLKNGLFDLGDYFHCYWSDRDRIPYICIIDGITVGFAFVRKVSTGVFSISEFFILRSFRQQGLATQFSHRIFNFHPGTWQVAQLATNKPAQAFWRKTIALFTNNNFDEQWSDSQPKGPQQVFNSTNFT
jgi:predicted acetyltransferase